MKQSIKKALRIGAVPLTFAVSAAASMYVDESIRLGDLEESAAYARATGIESAHENSSNVMKILTAPYKAAASDWLLDYREQLARSIFCEFRLASALTYEDRKRIEELKNGLETKN